MHGVIGSKCPASAAMQHSWAVPQESVVRRSFPRLRVAANLAHFAANAAARTCMTPSAVANLSPKIDIADETSLPPQSFAAAHELLEPEPRRHVSDGDRRHCSCVG